MDVIGEIVAGTDGAPINKQAWIDLIDHHPNLVRPSARTVTNPFDRKPMTVRPKRDVAGVIVNGVDVGTMEWFQDDENGINVMGDRSVARVAEDVATALGAEFRPAQTEDK